MELKDSPIMVEVDKIIKGHKSNAYFKYTLEIKVKDTYKEQFMLSERDKEVAPKKELNEKIFAPLKLVNIDIIRDYHKSYGDLIKAITYISYGQWVKILFPARDHLQAILTRIPLTEYNKEPELNGEAEVVVFDCLVAMRDELMVETSRYNELDKFQLDTTVAPLQVEFELLDRGLEALRKVTVGSIVRKASNEETIKTLIASTTEDLEVEEQTVVEKISVVKSQNEEEREHTVLKEGLRLLDMPNYIHEHCGGVYTTGINTYYQTNGVYVYPLFNTNRFEEEEKTLTILKVSEAQVPELERSYKLDGHKLTIIAFSESNFNEISKANRLRQGSGVRYADARMYMNQRVKTEDNKSKICRTKSNHEFIANEMEDQNAVFTSPESIHSNPFKEYSSQAEKNGGIYSMVWKHADFTLLYPGMPVRVLYTVNDEIKELRGSLMQAHVAIQATTPGLPPSGHSTQIALFVFANHYEET